MLPTIVIAKTAIPTYAILYFFCGFIAYKIFFRSYIANVGLQNSVSGIIALCLGAFAGSVILHNVMSGQIHSILSVKGDSQFGALIGGSLIFFGLLLRQIEPIRRFEMSHRFGLLIALGAACSRLGCFLKGCCWGSLTEAPWAVVYSHPESAMFYRGIPVHPFQLYEVLLTLLLFPAFSILRTKFRIHATHSFFLLFPIIRIFTDIFRPAPHRPEGFFYGYSMNQSIGLLLITISFLIVLSDKFWSCRIVSLSGSHKN